MSQPAHTQPGVWGPQRTLTIAPLAGSVGGVLDGWTAAALGAACKASWSGGARRDVAGPGSLARRGKGVWWGEGGGGPAAHQQPLFKSISWRHSVAAPPGGSRGLDGLPPDHPIARVVPAGTEPGCAHTSAEGSPRGCKQTQSRQQGAGITDEKRRAPREVRAGPRLLPLVVRPRGCNLTLKSVYSGPLVGRCMVRLPAGERGVMFDQAVPVPAGQHLSRHVSGTVTFVIRDPGRGMQWVKWFKAWQ